MTRIYLDDEPLGEVKRMSVQPDDVIVVECNRRVTAEEAARVKELIGSCLKGNAVLVVGDDARIVIVRPTTVPRAAPCTRTSFGGQIAGMACNDCGHANIVHGKKDGCAVCRLPLATGGVIAGTGLTIIGE